MGWVAILAAAAAATGGWNFQRVVDPATKQVRVTAAIGSADGRSMIGASCLAEGRGPFRFMVSSRLLKPKGMAGPRVALIRFDGGPEVEGVWTYANGNAWVDGPKAVNLARSLARAKTAKVRLMEVTADYVPIAFTVSGGSAPMGQVLKACRL